MRRDMELVRRILIELERADGTVAAIDLVDGDHDFACVAWHMRIMDEHGLIEARVVHNGFGSYTNASAICLTWEGSDFLDAVRDDRVWARTMRAVREAVGSTTIDVIKDLAKAIAASMLRAAAGV